MTHRPEPAPAPRPAPVREPLDAAPASGGGLLAGTLPAGVVHDAVLFDMDGTLVSSTASVERCWARLADEWGFHLDGFGFHGVPARQILDLLLPERTPAEREAALRRIEELEIADVEGVEVLPGAREALERLGPSRCAVVTSCTRPLAAARLAASGLPTVPVVTADDVAVGKPAPDPYLAGAALLGVDPTRCLAVEDAAAGLASARAAGAATLAVATTAQPQTLVADAVVTDLSAVRFVVDGSGVRVHLR